MDSSHNGETIKRVKNKSCNFSVVLNEVFQRPGLSARAKGIYAYIMTLPNDWVLHKSELYSHFTEGRESLDSAWKELEQLGYVVRELLRGDNGKILGSRYLAYESAQQNPSMQESDPSFHQVTEKPEDGEAPVSQDNAQNQPQTPDKPPISPSMQEPDSSFHRVTEKPGDGFTESGETVLRENRETVNPNLLNTDLNKLLNLQNTAAAAFPEKPQKPRGQSPPEAAADSGFLELKTALKHLDASFIFDPSFYPKAAAFLAKNKLSRSYLAFICEACKRKKAANPAGYFYRIFFEPRFVELYREQERAEAEKTAFNERPVLCPVCGTGHKASRVCPACGLDPAFAGNPEFIEQHKRFWAMTPLERAAAEQEIQEAIAKGGLTAYFKRRKQQQDDAGFVR